MQYTTCATGNSPAYIIFLVDLSASMNGPYGKDITRMEAAINCLERFIYAMIRRSRVGEKVRPRFYISLVGYNHSSFDLFGEVKAIGELVDMPLPNMEPTGPCNLAAALETAHALLLHYLPDIQDCPAPLVCNLTGSVSNEGADIEPICTAIKQMSTADGNVLFANIIIGNQILHTPIINPAEWKGVLESSEIVNPNLQNLWRLSSALPQPFARRMMSEQDCGLVPGAKMLIPIESSEMLGVTESLICAFEDSRD